MKYFSIDELCSSEVAERRGIANKPDADVLENLEALVDNVLDPLRDAFGEPIYVNSGYRSTLINNIVGGAKNSQHLRGEAADITGGTKEKNKKLLNYILRNLQFDQLINEGNFSWIHVSFKKRGKNRREFLAI